MAAGSTYNIRLLLPTYLTANLIFKHVVNVELQIVTTRLGRDLPVERNRRLVIDIQGSLYP
jgi:hypothetical protein